MSGDTVLCDAVREVASRLKVDARSCTGGAVKFGVSGPIRFTFNRPRPPRCVTLLNPRRRSGALRGLVPLPRGS